MIRAPHETQQKSVPFAGNDISIQHNKIKQVMTPIHSNNYSNYQSPKHINKSTQLFRNNVPKPST